MGSRARSGSGSRLLAVTVTGWQKAQRRLLTSSSVTQVGPECGTTNTRCGNTSVQHLRCLRATVVLSVLLFCQGRCLLGVEGTKAPNILCYVLCTAPCCLMQSLRMT